MPSRAIVAIANRPNLSLVAPLVARPRSRLRVARPCGSNRTSTGRGPAPLAVRRAALRPKTPKSQLLLPSQAKSPIPGTAAWPLLGLRLRVLAVTLAPPELRRAVPARWPFSRRPPSSRAFAWPTARRVAWRICRCWTRTAAATSRRRLRGATASSSSPRAKRRRCEAC